MKQIILPLIADKRIFSLQCPLNDDLFSFHFLSLSWTDWQERQRKKKPNGARITIIVKMPIEKKGSGEYCRKRNREATSVTVESLYRFSFSCRSVSCVCFVVVASFCFLFAKWIDIFIPFHLVGVFPHNPPRNPHRILSFFFSKDYQPLREEMELRLLTLRLWLETPERFPIALDALAGINAFFKELGNEKSC